MQFFESTKITPSPTFSASSKLPAYKLPTAVSGGTPKASPSLSELDRVMGRLADIEHNLSFHDLRQRQSESALSELKRSEQNLRDTLNILKSEMLALMRCTPRPGHFDEQKSQLQQDLREAHKDIARVQALQKEPRETLSKHRCETEKVSQEKYSLQLRKTELLQLGAASASPSAQRAQTWPLPNRDLNAEAHTRHPLYLVESKRLRGLSAANPMLLLDRLYKLYAHKLQIDSMVKSDPKTMKYVRFAKYQDSGRYADLTRRVETFYDAKSGTFVKGGKH